MMRLRLLIGSYNRRFFLFVWILIAALRAVAGTAQAAEYVLGPGDVVSVVVWGQPELSTSPGAGLEVRPDGKISFPLLGEVDVAGKSVSEVSTLLRDGLSEYVKNPRVSVNVATFRRIRVQALGQLKSPGHYEVAPDAQVLDLLAVAGGPTPAAALSEATLTRTTSGTDSTSKLTTTLPIDLDALLHDGDPAMNRTLQNGDVLFVPEARMVTVLGEVARPGTYPVRKGTRLLDIVAQAGGPTERAEAGAVRVYRGVEGAEGSEAALDDDRLLFQGDVEENPPLAGGEVIVMPKSRRIDWAKVFGFLAGLQILKELLGY